MESVVKYEAAFFRGDGYFPEVGLSCEGFNLDVDTGEPILPAENLTTPSSEAVHIGLLSKALEEEELAKHLYSTKEALTIV